MNLRLKDVKFIKEISDDNDIYIIFANKNKTLLPLN